MRAARIAERGVPVNDTHSGLNHTVVTEIFTPHTNAELLSGLRSRLQAGCSLSICGARHAMGGQQFLGEGVLLDTTMLKRVLELDDVRGEVEVEAGITWPELIAALDARSPGEGGWSIRQKQTGADELTLGGALSANIHGRGLAMAPFIQDIVAFTIVCADGFPRRCSRTEHRELFTLAVGGYGLFGVVSQIRIRLMPRQKMVRHVEIIDERDLLERFEARRDAGYLYGDFQFCCDELSADFLRRGVFSCYRPVVGDALIPASQKILNPADWRELIHLAHVRKSSAFQRYAEHYLATSGQVYWSDTMQLSTYLEGYHREIDFRTGARCMGSEMITEISVPRAALSTFLAEAREDLRSNGVNLIYGTIRLVEQDGDSALPWARMPLACVIFNLHVDHHEAGIERAKRAFRRLIDLGSTHGGTFYLTYHRFATPEQVRRCYPEIDRFFDAKRRYDPGEQFVSNWYRHYRADFGDTL